VNKLIKFLLLRYRGPEVSSYFSCYGGDIKNAEGVSWAIGPVTSVGQIGGAEEEMRDTEHVGENKDSNT